MISQQSASKWIILGDTRLAARAFGTHDCASMSVARNRPTVADPTSLDEVFPVVYGELRRLAALHLHREGDAHTLQPTELVHEAYMRLVGQRTVDWNDPAQLFGLASEMMRRLLVNHALARRAHKRGDGARPITLDPHHHGTVATDADLVALDEALTALAAVDARQARVVELRYFAGYSVEETARILALSTATVKREWASARLWLRREMQGV